MGVSLHYWAIPPQSGLYARLQESRAFNALLAALFPYGCGIYQFFKIDPEEVEEILEDAIERHRDMLGPEAEARRHIAAFRAELERTCAEHPGIERRTASLEKCSIDVEERLLRALAKNRTDATEFVRRLLFGDRDLSSHLRPPGEDILGLASVTVVREGARELEQMEPEALFAGDGWEEWCRENFQQWRQFYLHAAAHAEEILIGCR